MVTCTALDKQNDHLLTVKGLRTRNGDVIPRKFVLSSFLEYL